MFELLFLHPFADFSSGAPIWASGRSTASLALAICVAATLLAVSLRRTLFAVERGRAGWLVLGLQIAAVALALAVLWRPALRVERVEAGRNGVAVLIDTSRSMTFAEGGRSRLQAALERLEADALPALAERFALELYTFSDAREPLASLRELPAPGERSRLSAALQQTLRGAQGAPLSAVVLVSDGADPSGRERRELLDELARRGIPVHTVGAGREVMPEDLELSDVRLPALALAGTRVTAEVTLRHATKGEARLVVRDGERVLAARSVGLDPEQRVQTERIELDAGEGGLLDLQFSLDPLPDERILGNNRLARVLEVSARKRRVLYLEGEPRWEYKFLRRAIDDDPALELVSLLRTTSGKLYRQGVRSENELAAGFGEAVDSLFEYDVLILGSVEASAWTPAQQERMREFVATRGGSLLMLAGPQGLGDGRWGASALAEALPVRLASAPQASFAPGETRARLTQHGNVSALLQLDLDPRTNRQLWEALPPLADHQRVGELKPGAVSLLETAGDAAGAPLLVVQRYGRGQAGVLATSGTWRWRMHAGPEDAHHARFWRQLLRSLAGSAPDPVQATLEITPESDASRVQMHVDVRSAAFGPVAGATLEAQLQVQGASPRPLDVRRSPDGEAFDAEVAVEPGTLFRVDAVAKRGDQALGAVTLHRRAPQAELEDFRPEQDRAFLEQIATASGGRYWTGDALAELPRAVEASPSAITRTEVLELWSAPAFLLLLLALCAAEWTLRRTRGVL